MFNPENWNWAIWLYVSIMFAGLLGSAHFHGQPKGGRHNFFVDVVVLAIAVTILTFAGLFK